MKDSTPDCGRAVKHKEVVASGICIVEGCDAYIVTATIGSCGINAQGVPRRQLNVTFGSSGPRAMWFGYAESKRSGEEGGVSAQTCRTCDAARADAYRVPPALHN